MIIAQGWVGNLAGVIGNFDANCSDEEMSW
jgi:hypothetical protein